MKAKPTSEVSAHHGTARLSFLLLSLVVAAVVDVSILKTANFVSNGNDLASIFGVATFTAITITMGAVQVLVLYQIKSLQKEFKISFSNSEQIVVRSVVLVQLAVPAILATIILEMVTHTAYHLALLEAALLVGYLSAIFTLSILALKFISWYRLHKDPKLILYGVSCIGLVLNSIFTIGLALLFITEKNPTVVPHVGIPAVYFKPGSLKDTFNKLYISSSIISFILMWMTTAILLFFLSRKIGKIQYWLLFCAALGYFLLQFVTLLSTDIASAFGANRTVGSFALTLVFTYSRIVGGVLFGLAFWIAARKLESETMRKYMILCGFGFMLFFITNQGGVLVSTPFYPPFGLTAASYIGQSSYLIFLGITYSGLSLSQDQRILRSIKKSAASELSMIRSIGSAELEEKILNKIMQVAKRDQNRLYEESGMDSSLTDKDLKYYMDGVVKEIEESKEDKKPPPTDG